MPKVMKALWDHRTLSAERTADNLRVDCDVVYPRVFFELIDRDLLVAPAAAQSFSRCSERRAVGLSHIGQLEYLLHHGMTGHDALHCRLHAFHNIYIYKYKYIYIYYILYILYI